jgi:glucose-6-phosphate 1-dehydrogenase
LNANNHINETLWTVIILGVTGDLAKRKLIPALSALVENNEFKGIIVGTGREDVSPEDVVDKARSFIKHGSLDALKKKFLYHKVDFDQPQDFRSLEVYVKEAEQKMGIRESRRLVYCATAAHYFCQITENLVASGIIAPKKAHHVVVFEKPFGWDSSSAQTINACIKEHLDENQVYRIDHYLAKEFVSNIVLLRYSNTLFKTIWDHQTIQAVRILFTETIGIEGRGAFYDKFGAIKDVLQNHMLQILALVAMEAPKSLDADALRDKKAAVLRALRVDRCVFGQLEEYRSESGVAPDSQTETYAAAKLFVDTPQWKDVPFYLETGKGLSRKTTEVQLIFKEVPSCLWSESGASCASNILTIHITPDEGFSLRLNTKKPGTMNDITTVTLNFSDRTVFGPTSTEAYEILLKEIMAGNRSLGVRFDEIEYQWILTDTLYAMKETVEPYKKGSAGPREGRALMDERL